MTRRLPVLYAHIPHQQYKEEHQPQRRRKRQIDAQHKNEKHSVYRIQRILSRQQSERRKEDDCVMQHQKRSSP